MFAVSSNQNIQLPEQYLNSALFTLDLGACHFLGVRPTSECDSQEETDVDARRDVPVQYAALLMVHSSGSGLKARRIRCLDCLHTTRVASS